VVVAIAPPDRLRCLELLAQVLQRRTDQLPAQGLLVAKDNRIKSLILGTGGDITFG
jgi:hypothetical protein